MKKLNNIKPYSLTVFMAILAGCGGSEPNGSLVTSAVDNTGSVSLELIPQPASTNNDTVSIKNISDKHSMQGLVDDANFVFKGTLVDISNAVSIENIPYTFVTYNVDEVIAGDYQESAITLKFVGGEFPNGNRLTASNSPNVQLGEESVLFVQQSLDTGCDFVQCEKGRFLLVDGKVIAANEKAVVIDDNNGIDYISYADQRNGKHKSSLNKPNIRNFISHLKGLNTSTLSKKKIAKSADQQVPFKAYASLTQAGQPPVAMLSSKQVEKSTLVAKGSAHDQWEVEQLKHNGGNPLIK